VGETGAHQLPIRPEDIVRLAHAARTAIVTIALAALATLTLTPSAGAAVGGDSAWGAGATCWAGQFEMTVTVQGAYDGQWVAARRYVAVWNAQRGQWQGQYSGWQMAQDPAGPASAISTRWQTPMPAGTAIQLWYQVAFYGAGGWSVLGWSPAAHTTHRWNSYGTVSTTSGAYCLVT